MRYAKGGLKVQRDGNECSHSSVAGVFVLQCLSRTNGPIIDGSFCVQLQVVGTSDWNRAAVELEISLPQTVQALVLVEATNYDSEA